ncbi:MAG: hypothetical protein RRC34_07175 [Lentisphaeria bacterium]|nr:hypothetical protein [Lentisphaeria bacterium]
MLNLCSCAFLSKCHACLGAMVLAACFGNLFAGRVVVETGASEMVYPGPDGKLVYVSDDQGGRLPDFSHVGYHSGARPIPDVPVRVMISPVEGDMTALIQRVVNQLGEMPVDANGHRGAVLLKRGVYRVEGSLRLSHSGIVLRGEGNGPDGTVIVAAGYGDIKHKRTLITVGDGNRAKPIPGSRRNITDGYVPVGARSFTVESAEGYQVGDRVLVHRPSTTAWISAIGCDNLKSQWTRVTDVRWVEDGPRPGVWYQRAGLSHPTLIPKKENETWKAFKTRVPLSGDGKKLDTTRQWRAGSYDLNFERRITAIDGNRITIDAPIVHTLDTAFGGGAVFNYETPGRVTEAGIENLRLVSEFADPIDGRPYGSPKEASHSENHAWNAIKLHRNSENTWVRNVTAHYFGWSVVSASGIRATVTDCVSLGHASRIAGGRRYPFMIDGQMNLVQRCVTFEGRHEFVTQARTAGPNVFVDCVGFNSKSSAGPHHRYSVGTLFDNVKSGHYMESRFRGSSGSGHGWAGTQTCFYNCIAPDFKVQAPPGGMAWVIGSGREYSAATRTRPPSLYYRQVEDRLGKRALDYLSIPGQRENMGRFQWVENRLKPEKRNPGGTAGESQ